MIARKENGNQVKTCDNAPEPEDDGNKTVGRRIKVPVLVLKARKGDFTIVPENNAVIGRGEDSPYREFRTMNLVSRRHGKFVRKGRDWYIVDFGSTNGTLVNDVELEPDVPVKFSAGDVVDIGTYIFDVILK